MEQQQYRFSWPPEEFWDALLEVRNYLYKDPVFSFYCCMHHEEPLATNFWIVDKWLDAALLKRVE